MTEPIPRSRLAARDMVGEAVTAISRRPARSILTALGTVVGVGAFVATLGLASTAQAQVGDTFDALKATEVRVVDAQPTDTNPFPDDATARLVRLNGVNHAGVAWEIDTIGLDPRSLATPSRRPSQLPVVAAEPDAVLAALPTIQQGVVFDTFHDDRAEHVAILGRAAAEQLGVTRVDNQPAVFLGNDAYTVIGIIDDVARNPNWLLSIIVPAETATASSLPPVDATYEVLIDVAPGAAQLIGHQAPLALRPQQSERLQALVPPDPSTLRESIERDVQSLLLGLAVLALVVGSIGIANTTLVSVMERRNEIGVRRAMGARPRHIAAQFLTESGALGALGGITGTSLGILTVAAISATRGWTTTINPTITLIAPLIGAATGVLAGLYPALKAARTDPAHALRTT